MSIAATGGALAGMAPHALDVSVLVVLSETVCGGGVKQFRHGAEVTFHVAGAPTLRAPYE